MGPCYLPHEETGGEQHIISVVETLYCYHGREGSIAYASPKTENRRPRRPQGEDRPSPEAMEDRGPGGASEGVRVSGGL